MNPKKWHCAFFRIYAGVLLGSRKDDGILTQNSSTSWLRLYFKSVSKNCLRFCRHLYIRGIVFNINKHSECLINPCYPMKYIINKQLAYDTDDNPTVLFLSCLSIIYLIRKQFSSKSNGRPVRYIPQRIPQINYS